MDGLDRWIDPPKNLHEPACDAGSIKTNRIRSEHGSLGVSSLRLLGRWRSNLHGQITEWQSETPADFAHLRSHYCCCVAPSD